MLNYLIFNQKKILQKSILNELLPISTIEWNSGDQNTEHSNYGTIQIVNFKIASSPCQITVSYSGHNLTVQMVGNSDHHLKSFSWVFNLGMLHFGTNFIQIFCTSLNSNPCGTKYRLSGDKSPGLG